jgi:Glycosyl transferase family 2/N-terminal domain of galactosyltransferase
MYHAQMPQFSIITTCKGRLDHLKQTLPQFVKQNDTQVIVVDCACPQHSGDWVRQHFPQIAVVELRAEEYFRANHARNSGAAQANAPYLIFLDADTLVADDFAGKIEPALAPGSFLRFRFPEGNDLNGACVVPAEAFRAVCGYDEVIEGYGGEEQELYWRLRRRGLTMQHLLAEGVCRPIAHDNQSRIVFHREKDMNRAFLQVRAYRLCKEAVLGVMFTPELSKPQREALWHAVEKAITANDHDIRIEVPHPDINSGFLRDWEMSRVVHVRLRRKGSVVELPAKTPSRGPAS